MLINIFWLWKVRKLGFKRLEGRVEHLFASQGFEGRGQQLGLICLGASFVGMLRIHGNFSEPRNFHIKLEHYVSYD